MHSDFCNGHASIRVSLPRNHCEQVRDVIQVFSVLEEVYNHLYAWCLFVHEAAAEPDGVNGYHASYPSVCSFTGLLDGVPDEDRLCVARIEVNPPAFVEIVGAHRVLRAMRAYLSAYDADPDEFARAPKVALYPESVDFVRREVDLLNGLNFSEIQEALSKHILVPLARLEKLRGIRLYEEKNPLAEGGQSHQLR